MSSLAIEPMDRVMRRMILLSAGLHLLGMAVAAAWMAWHTPRARFLPVAVVDLVGGKEFARRPVPFRAPAGSESRAPALPASRGKAAPATALRRAPAREAPDTVSLAERIRQLREKRETSEQVREAVGVIRKQREARSAVRRIGERVAHRVDLSRLAPARKQAVPPAGGGPAGAVGKARVPPEILAYFQALDERIRENWTVPEPALAGSRNLIVQLRITIEKDGEVTNVRMEKTSGNSYFDDSVLRAITKASPLPVPPEQLRGTEDHYEIGFRFFGGGEAS
ncbi:MAG: hypothetical protein Kow00128_22130 [Deltaproteobacteria bacterium]